MEESYTEIQIHVGPADGAGLHPVDARLGDGSFFEGGRLELNHQKLLLAALDPQAYGLELFATLFSGRIRDALNQATGQANARTEGRLRVRLWLDTQAPELHVLPWERLYQIHRGSLLPLAATASTPFSRYVPMEIAEEDPVTVRPVRVLVVFSNPEGLPRGLTPLDVEREVEVLRGTFVELLRTGRVEATLLPGRSGLPGELRARMEGEGFRIEEGTATWERVVELLQDRQILHFVGHGSLSKDEGAAALHLERQDGAWKAVADRELVPKLAAMDPVPRLVFLAACESAKLPPGTPNPYVGLGPKLVVEGKVPAVVAMQDLVPMELARKLGAHFYRGLFKHGFVDRALNEARNLLMESEGTDWAIPVLFMRLRDGRLIAADPVLEALEAIAEWAKDPFVPIAVEAVHVRGRQESSGLELPGWEDAPAVDVLRAIDFVFSPLMAIFQRFRGFFAKLFKNEVESPQARLVGLVGGQGMTKTTQLRRIAHQTALRSLRLHAGKCVVPVLVDLRGFGARRSGVRNPVETLVLSTLAEFWPALTATTIAELRRSHPDLRLRILFDGSDEMADGERREAWELMQRLVTDEPDQQYVLAVDAAQYDAARLKQVTDLLVIQRLSRRGIGDFLGRSGTAGARLEEALHSKEMFDLAALPWLLIRMLEQARRGVYPKSRADVLSGLVEDSIARIDISRGMRSGAGRTLNALAWRMAHERIGEWSVGRLFQLMAEVRGNREYSLEELFDQMVRCGVLSRLGEDTVRFAQDAVRDCCCAQAIAQMSLADRERVLDDVVASLGPPTRLLWWEETLILLAGLLDDPNHLLRRLLYGAVLSEGAQVFLAARCLQEALNRRGGPPVEDDLVNQLVGALVWRLDPGTERLIGRRVQAAKELGRLRLPETISDLARVANQKVRPNWRGELDYDLSVMRMAAGQALRSMVPKEASRVKAADGELARLLRLWSSGNRAELAKWLRSGEEGSRPLAAFALADLYSPETPQPLEDLLAAFLAPRIPPATRWAVTEALTLIDPQIVRERAVHPFLAEDAETSGLDPKSWKERAAWYERLAYLIGKGRIQGELTDAFLARSFKEWRRVGVKARAIQALGRLQDSRYKESFERLALGNLTEVALSATVTEEDVRYLRSKAIEALGAIGDQDTLTRLRRGRSDWHPELERAFYLASEEISWRASRRARGVA